MNTMLIVFGLGALVAGVGSGLLLSDLIISIFY